MPDQPPSHPLFDVAPGASRPTTTDPDDWFGLADERDKSRLVDVREHLKRATDDSRDKRPFQPHLLVRARAGDRGDRPISSVFWESPDIWVRAGDPASNPAAPTSQAPSVVAGRPHTLYAHVWNLGLAPVMGASVEFLVFDPSLTFASQTPLFRATTRVDLGGRMTPAQCHRLVKCPRAWVPTIVNSGHECLMVRVSCVGDAIQPAHQWDAWADRHVAQRNIGVVSAGASIAPILKQLDVHRLEGLRIQLLQVGAEDVDVLRLHAPQWRVDPRVSTEVLAELGADTSLTVLTDVVGASSGPAVRRRPVRRIAVDRLLDLALPDDAGAAFLQERTELVARTAAPAARAGATRTMPAGARMADLFRHAERLDKPVRGTLPELGEPATGDAQVLRVAGYQGDQLVGGYTVVVTSAR